jgi:predicted nucleotidyltransferase
MWLSRPLDDILSSGTKVAILRLLCTRRGPWSGREIARQTGLSSSNCARALHELTAAMVVEAHPVGNAIAYGLVKTDTPLVQSLRALFAAESDRREQLVGALRRRLPGLVALVLFGSEARGEARAGSDADLLVIVRERSAPLEAEVDRVCMEESLAQLLQGSWVVGDLADVQRWEAEGSPFWANILRDGVVLAGWSLARLQRHGHMADTMASGAGILGSG